MAKTLANVADKIIKYLDDRARLRTTPITNRRDAVVEIMLEEIPECFRSEGSDFQSALARVTAEIEAEERGRGAKIVADFNRGIVPESEVLDEGKPED